MTDQIIYEERLGQLESDVSIRIAKYVADRYGMDFNTALYNPNCRRAAVGAAAVFWADYFESDKEL